MGGKGLPPDKLVRSLERPTDSDLTRLMVKKSILLSLYNPFILNQDMIATRSYILRMLIKALSQFLCQGNNRIPPLGTLLKLAHFLHKYKILGIKEDGSY